MNKSCENCKYYGMESLVCGRCDDDSSCWEKRDIPLSVIDEIKAEIFQKHYTFPTNSYYDEGARLVLMWAYQMIDEKVKEYTDDRTTEKRNV